MSDWIRKQDPPFVAFKKQILSSRTDATLGGKKKGWRNVFHTNGTKKRADTAILISDKQSLNQN